MNPYEVVIKHCKQLEQQLETQFGATGRGLHEKASSVAHRLPPTLIRRLRFIATVRNRQVHEATELSAAEVKNYDEACVQARTEIERLSESTAADLPKLPATSPAIAFPDQPLRHAPVQRSIAPIPPPRCPPQPATSLLQQVIRRSAPVSLSERSAASEPPQPAPEVHLPLRKSSPSAPRRRTSSRLGPLLIACAIPLLMGAGLFFLHRAVSQHLAADPGPRSAFTTSEPDPPQPASSLPIIAPGRPGIHRELPKRR